MNELQKMAEIEVSYAPSISPEQQISVSSIDDAFNFIWLHWNHGLIAYQESFLVLFCNRANKLLGYRWISKGGLSSTVVDIRHVLGIALKCNASSILIAHNHPSGNLKPSEPDLKLMEKIKAAANIMDIELLDHIIIAPNKDFYSFKQEGVL